jgi:hypothetical protein
MHSAVKQMKSVKVHLTGAGGGAASPEVSTITTSDIESVDADL